MSNSIDDQPALTSPPCSLWLGAELMGSVVPRAQLAPTDRDRMYELLSAYFDGTERDRFEDDLAEKDAVVLLRDSITSEIQGFSTFQRMEIDIDSRDIVAFYSGDTIVAKEYWGETILSRLWSQTIFAEADLIRADRPSAEVFWFLICSGYKTYRFLPVFFRESYPCLSCSTPCEIKRILDALGNAKFGNQYDAQSGIVRFAQATPLRQGVAEVTERRLNDPMVAFFNSVNPGHACGDELACITRVSRDNVTRAGARMLVVQNSPERFERE
jgi:hypothetical protein